MRIGIIACQVLREEIEAITDGDPDVVHREYLERGLHDSPDRLRDTVIERVEALEGKVDVVFLGYAICQSLDAVPSAIKLPFVMLREEDCIASILGPEEYTKEKAICIGTWFSSPGWAEWWGESGLEMLVREEEMQGLEELGYSKFDFAKMQFDGYSRCLAIDTGVGGFERCLSLSEDFAERFGFKCEQRKGDIKVLRKAWNDVKDGRWHLPSELTGYGKK